MSAHPHRREQDERAELAALLPAPEVHALTPGRHRQLKDHLMHELHPTPTTAAVVPGRRPRRRFVLTAIPVAAAAAAAAVGVATLTHPGTTTPQRAASSVIAVPAGSSQGVAAMAEQIADVALTARAPAISRRQYVYIKSVVAFSRPTHQRTFDGHQVLDALHDREVWLPQDPAKPGLIRENGHDTSLGGHGYASVDGAPAKPVGAGNTTYAQLAALPTDPTALLNTIRADTRGHGTDRNAEAFTWIGDQLTEAIVPPKLTAAMLRATARIPGVIVVHDAVDATGRHGQALALTTNGERTELIFDTTTHTYLGERSYLVTNTTAGKAGTLTASTAVLTRAVVNTLGQTPHPTA